MKICIVGTGYVGLTTGVCLAELGHIVTCVDKIEEKVKTLSQGICPIHEPGLSELLQKALRCNKIFFTTDINKAIQDNDWIFIAVGTPGLEDGSADLSAVSEVVSLIGQLAQRDKFLVVKSTVPIGTNKKITQQLNDIKNNNINFAVLSNPEFLRQGKALQDTLCPDRIVIGGNDQSAIDQLKKIYQGIASPIIITTLENAEIIKYASNSFLALKISYINEIANVCEKFGADVKEVARGMGLDPRIGDRFLEAGIGFGGSCFPKDMKALLIAAKKIGYDFKLLQSALNVNKEQKMLAVAKLKKYLGDLSGKKIALFGLSFKADTDDIREASSITLIQALLSEKAIILVHDPKASTNMRKLFPQLNYCDSPYDAANDADGLVLVTEWPEYGQLDMNRIRKKMKKPVLIDGRNFFDLEEMFKLGFTYEGVGRIGNGQA